MGLDIRSQRLLLLHLLQTGLNQINQGRDRLVGLNDGFAGSLRNGEFKF